LGVTILEDMVMFLEKSLNFSLVGPRYVAKEKAMERAWNAFKEPTEPDWKQSGGILA
jgi:hypothetical protein